MAQIAIRLNTLTEVKEFNAAAAQIPGDVDLRSGHYSWMPSPSWGYFP